MNRLISAVFEINGELVHVGKDGAPMIPEAVDPGLYDEAGWSFAMPYGCVSNKTVDEHLALMAVGDKYQQEVAGEAPDHFAVILADRDYDNKTIVNLRRNYQQDNDTFTSGFLGGMMFEPFHVEMFRDRGGQVRPISEALANFTTPIFGFNPNVIHETLADKYIAELNRRVAGTRSRAENPNAPKASPRG